MKNRIPRKEKKKIKDIEKIYFKEFSGPRYIAYPYSLSEIRKVIFFEVKKGFKFNKRLRKLAEQETLKKINEIKPFVDSILVSQYASQLITSRGIEIKYF